jgi:hypothetical protein
MQLDFDSNEINVIVQALEQGPFRVVAPVLMKIQGQVMTQQAQQAQPAPPEEVSAGGTD